MILTDEDGNRYEADAIYPGNQRYWALTPLSKEYRFGSIVLVETGETRAVAHGEFYLSKGATHGPLLAANLSSGHCYPILKPVRIEDGSDEHGCPVS